VCAIGSILNLSLRAAQVRHCRWSLVEQSRRAHEICAVVSRFGMSRQ
jgi:hypothetical protein